MDSRKLTTELVEDFKNRLKTCKHLVVLTGAGISAESGIPTFRGEGGYWRNFNAMELATPQAFKRDASLVWQFYQFRREKVLDSEPNDGHRALVECEKRFTEENRKFTLITQNVDGLHLRAGSKRVIQMHGNILETKCTKCNQIQRDISVLVDSSSTEKIPKERLPKCKNCNGLLRPNVVWFNESLNRDVMNEIEEELNDCDLFIIVGTSGVVYPAAGFASQVKSRNVRVAEFNIEPSSAFSDADYYFQGKCGQTLPKYLS